MRHINNFVIGIAILLFPFYAKSQVVGFEAEVKEYGQLESVLGENWDKIDSLAVVGPINASDFKTMWKCAFEGTLNVLNLEKAEVENSKIPDFALYDGNKQYWDVDVPIYLDIHKIILPDNIVEIGTGSFQRMKLEKINLPKSLQKLNIGSFANCHWLNVDPLVIPEGITEIPSQCFVNCQNFKKLILPKSLQVIKEVAFYNTRMEEVEFAEGLESIENSAFYGSGELKKAILPNSCQMLDEFVFGLCDSLKELRIPEGIKSIPTHFAAYSIKLEYVDIPESVEEIGYGAFQMCNSLKNITLPNNLSTIQGYAFDSCCPDSIVFPASLTLIGYRSCNGWQNIKKIFSLSKTPPYCDGHAFDNCNDATIYVPLGASNLYSNAQDWSYFTKFVETNQLPESGIKETKYASKSNTKVYWSNGLLYLENIQETDFTQSYSIYSIDGKMVDFGKVEASQKVVSVPQGVYIVILGDSVYKVR